MSKPTTDDLAHAERCSGLATLDQTEDGTWIAACSRGDHRVTGEQTKRGAALRFYGGEQPGLAGPVLSARAAIGGNATTRQTSAPLDHLSLNATNRFADFFVRAVEQGYMLLDAPYQRGAVWTVGQQMGLVRSWMSGLPIPAVIINDRTSTGWSRNAAAGDTLEHLYSVIDGKQRILTAIAWFGGELLVPASWFPAEHIERAEATDDGDYVRYTGLTRVGQRFAENHCVLPCAEGRLASVEAEAEVYLLVNGAGTPQTDVDLARAAAAATGKPA